jgi:colicin import membrane protein
MKTSDGGGTTKPKPTAAQKKAAAARKKKLQGAQKFATDQLTKAGIKPKKPGKGVIAQFSAANKKAAAARTKNKLGTISGTGASSSLTAGDKKGAPRVKPTAEQFATNQLKRAGIKVGSGDVTAQFRAANKVAAAKRRKAGLDRARTAGASSALTAGMRGPKVKKSAAQERRGTGSASLKPAVKPSAAKSKAQGY